MGITTALTSSGSSPALRHLHLLLQRLTRTTATTGMDCSPMATPLLVLVASPPPGPQLLVSASRALFTGPVERGVLMPMLTTATASVLLTMEATPPPTLTGLPKASASTTDSTTERGVRTLQPTILMVSFWATTTTCTPGSLATTTPPACPDTPLLLSPISARGKLNPQLMLMLMPRPIPTTVTAAGTATDSATTVDITVTVMALAMVMVTTAK